METKTELTCDLNGYTLYVTTQAGGWAWSVSNEAGTIDNGGEDTEMEARTKAVKAALKHMQDIYPKLHPKFYWYRSEYSPGKVKLKFDEL